MAAVKGPRARLKQVIPTDFWPLLRHLDRVVVNGMYLGFWGLRKIIYPRIPEQSGDELQSIEILDIHQSLPHENPEDLAQYLESLGYKCHQGRHSVYLYDFRDIERFSPDIFKRYPAPVGLKIIRNRDLAPDGSPYYTSSKIAPATTWFSMRAIGSMVEKMVVSNILSQSGVAPRVYAIVKLGREDKPYYAFVVEHIEGSICRGKDADTFMEKFKTTLETLGLNTLSVSEHRDLRSPDYNNNIIYDGNSAKYVDIQNFVFTRKPQLEGHFNLCSKINPVVSLAEAQICQLMGNIDYRLKDQSIAVLGVEMSCLLLSFLKSGLSWGVGLATSEDEQMELYNSFYFKGFGRFDFIDLSSENDHRNEKILKDISLAICDLDDLEKFGVERFFCHVVSPYLLCLVKGASDTQTALQRTQDMRILNHYQYHSFASIDQDPKGLLLLFSRL